MGGKEREKGRKIMQGAHCDDKCLVKHLIDMQQEQTLGEDGGTGQGTM